MTEHKENKTRNPKHHSVLSITLQWMASAHPRTETDFKYIFLCIIFYLQLLDAPRLVLVLSFGEGGEAKVLNLHPLLGQGVMRIIYLWKRRFLYYIYI